MNPDEMRKSERERREAAQKNRGRVVAGSGQAVAGRKLDQMVSLRLDPEVLSALRDLATRSGRSVSDLVREAVVQFIGSANSTRFTVQFLRVETGIEPNLALVDNLVGSGFPVTWADVVEEGLEGGHVGVMTASRAQVGAAAGVGYLGGWKEMEVDHERWEAVTPRSGHPERRP